MGASGDLAPLAHLAVGLLGEGKCYYKGELIRCSEAMKQAEIEPFRLRQKKVFRY